MRLCSRLQKGEPPHRASIKRQRAPSVGARRKRRGSTAAASMSTGLRRSCSAAACGGKPGAGANRRPLAGGGASPSPSPARLAAVRGATRRREARVPPEVPFGADHASFLSSIRDHERLSALSTKQAELCCWALGLGLANISFYWVGWNFRYAVAYVAHPLGPPLPNRHVTLAPSILDFIF